MNMLYYMYVIPYGEGNGTPLQYFCLENPMDGGSWQAAVHGVAKSRTRLSDFAFTFHFHALEKEMTTHSSVLAWRIPGTGEPGGCRLWGHTESDMTEVTQHSIAYTLYAKHCTNLSELYDNRDSTDFVYLHICGLGTVPEIQKVLMKYICSVSQ